MLTEEFRSDLAALRRRGLVFDALVLPQQLQQRGDLARVNAD
jgi:hypothetical protein